MALLDISTQLLIKDKEKPAFFQRRFAEFKAFQSTSTFTDMDFYVGDNVRVGAHKNVITLHSSFMKAQLDDDRTNAIILPDVRREDMEVLLQLLYTGMSVVPVMQGGFKDLLRLLHIELPCEDLQRSSAPSDVVVALEDDPHIPIDDVDNDGGSAENKNPTAEENANHAIEMLRAKKSSRRKLPDQVPEITENTKTDEKSVEAVCAAAARSMRRKKSLPIRGCRVVLERLPPTLVELYNGRKTKRSDRGGKKTFFDGSSAYLSDKSHDLQSEGRSHISEEAAGQIEASETVEQRSFRLSEEAAGQIEASEQRRPKKRVRAIDKSEGSPENVPKKKSTTASGDKEAALAVQCYFCYNTYQKNEIKYHTFTHFQKELETEIANAENTTPFVCPVCQKDKFRSPMHRLQHYAFKHKVILQYCSAVELAGKAPAKGLASSDIAGKAPAKGLASSDIANHCVCSLCGKRYSRKDSMQMHMVDIHFKEQLTADLSKSQSKPSQCPSCPKVETNKSKLLLHYAFRHKNIHKYSTNELLSERKTEKVNSIENESYFAEVIDEINGVSRTTATVKKDKNHKLMNLSVIGEVSDKENPGVKNNENHETDAEKKADNEEENEPPSVGCEIASSADETDEDGGDFVECRFCDESYPKSKQKMAKFKRHVVNHFKAKLMVDLPKTEPFVCPICESKTPTRTSLMMHYAIVHKIIYKYCSKKDFNGKRRAPKDSKTEKKLLNTTHSTTDATQEHTKYANNKNIIGDTIDTSYGEAYENKTTRTQSQENCRAPSSQLSQNQNEVDVPQVCFVCKVALSSEGEMKGHLEFHYTTELINFGSVDKCPYCPFVATSGLSLPKHHGEKHLLLKVVLP